MLLTGPPEQAAAQLIRHLENRGILDARGDVVPERPMTEVSMNGNVRADPGTPGAPSHAPLLEKQAASEHWAKCADQVLRSSWLSNSVHGEGRTKKQARMLDIVRQQLPDVGEPLMLTLNKNVTCGRHKDGRNASDVSYIMFFDGAQPYTGGELVVEEPGGDRILSEKNHSVAGSITTTTCPT